MTKHAKGDADMKTKKHEFYVKAVWDEEANVFYTDSNIKGLHIETKTIEEFADLVKEFAPELIFNNHFKKEYMQKEPTQVQKLPVRIQKSSTRIQKNASPERFGAVFSLPAMA